MSDTPKTDALREVIIGQYKEDELTGNGMGNILAALTDIETLERERECECKCDVDWPEEYYELRQRLERERDAERDLADRLAAAATAVIDQWDTPNWKLTESTATCMNTLRNALVACKESRQDRNHS